MEPAEGERVFPPFSMPLFGSPSVLLARPPPARLVPDCSFQKGRRTHTATALPLTRSLGRTFAWAPQAAARLLLCLARPPRPSIATRPPTFLPSFSPKRYPPLPPTSLPVEARKPQVCSMQYHRVRRLSHLSGFPSSTATSVHPSHSFEAFFAPLLRAIEYWPRVTIRLRLNELLRGSKSSWSRILKGSWTVRAVVEISGTELGSQPSNFTSVKQPRSCLVRERGNVRK